MRRLRIYYKTSNRETIKRIRDRFGFPEMMTVNGEWTVEVRDEDMELLKETQRRGFIEIRNKECDNTDFNNILN